MRIKWGTLSMAMTVGLAASSLAQADAGVKTDFSNPAVTIANEAAMASGVCIAKYVSVLDDPSKPAAVIGARIAERCSKQLARSAGLASYLLGKPEQYANYLKYAREDLTTGAVTRSRSRRI